METNISCRHWQAWANPSRGPQLDRRGRRLSTAQNGTTAYTYHDSGALLSEDYTGGTLAGMNIQYTLDSLLRRSSVTARNGTTGLATTSYTYDGSSRLASVGDGTHSASYAYLANSPLVSQITFKENTTTRMTSTRHYDFLNRLGSIVSTPAASSAISRAYQYNAANRRTRVTLGDLSAGQANGSYWLYEYDTLGQVRSGKRYWNDHMPVPGQQFEYGFDDIGNRAATQTGGDSEGAGLRASTYTANLLNQYSQRTVPASFDVLGVANAAQTVNVNGSAADYRRGEYFQESVAAGNSATAVWQGVSVTTSGGGSGSGNVFVPKTPEVFTYDLDGNTLTDGRWNYTWDAENRLVTLVGHTGVGQPLRLDFEYDAQGRRIRKRVWNNTAGTGSPALERKYIYDGWNLLVELDGANAVVNSFTWGLDLSGTLQGAGGVGGLIAIKPAASAARFAAYDGNGNVVALIDAGTGQTDTHYEYGPFGESLRATGAMATANPFRFSTKYTDGETDLVYYGHRYYNSSTGRWPSRDPIEEKGGRNLYAFVGNNGVNSTDPLGLLETAQKAYRAATECDSDPSIRVRPFKCGITIVAGHAYFTDEDTGEILPVGGLINEAKSHLELNKQGKLQCQKYCYVGCKSSQLNEAAVDAGIGVPGIEGNYHPRNIFPGEANRDLLLTGLLNSHIRQAIQRANAEAQRICKANKCACKEITIHVTCEGVTSSLCGHKEVVKCE